MAKKLLLPKSRRIHCSISFPTTETKPRPRARLPARRRRPSRVARARVGKSNLPKPSLCFWSSMHSGSYWFDLYVQKAEGLGPKGSVYRYPSCVFYKYRICLRRPIFDIFYHVRNDYNYTTSLSLASSASDPSGRNGHSMYALVKAFSCSRVMSLVSRYLGSILPPVKASLNSGPMRSRAPGPSLSIDSNSGTEGCVNSALSRPRLR
jgi:hypothetical protein